MMEAFLTYLGYHTAFTVLFFLLGRAIRRAIGAKSEARRIHGRYVFWWSVGAFAIAGPLGPLVAGADAPNGAMGFAMFCFLGGWLVGCIHGAVVLAVQPPPQDAGDSDATTTDS
jgi:hypothetical protein